MPFQKGGKTMDSGDERDLTATVMQALTLTTHSSQLLDIKLYLEETMSREVESGQGCICIRVM